MRKTSLFFLTAFFMLVLPISALAYTVKSGSSVYIPKDETVDGNFYAAGQTITIEGRVKGDVICAGQIINIRGQVDGDVICAGQSINIEGNTGGSLRVPGSNINIDSNIARSAMAFGATITASASSTVGWDMMVGGAIAELRGRIGRDLSGGGSKIIIGGQVGKNVKLSLDGGDYNRSKKNDSQVTGLTVVKNAKIGGDLNYSSSKEGEIEKGAKIIGKTNWTETKPKNMGTGYGGWVLAKIISIFSALVIGLVIISLWKKQIKTITDKMLEKIAPSIGWGAAIFFLTPIICVILAITVIGIPLGLIIMALWFIAVYIAKIIAAITIGRSLLWKVKDESLVWSMLAGIIASWLIFSIPFLGWLLSLVVIWWGLGAIWTHFYKV